MKSKYEELVNQNKSSHAIAKELGISQTTVRYWLKKYNLKTKIKHSCYSYESDTIDATKKKCPQCQEIKLISNENFYIRKKSGKPHAWCKKCNDRIAHQKQLQRKKQAVEYKGGKCCVCGYNKYIGALDFHHLNPDEKEFNIAELRSYEWKTIQKEVDKCILVCRNCHAEIHGGLVKDELLVVAPGLEPGTSPL